MQIKREQWYGSVVQALNLMTANLLAAGKITQEQHDAIVTENRIQAQALKD